MTLHFCYLLTIPIDTALTAQSLYTALLTLQLCNDPVCSRVTRLPFLFTYLLLAHIPAQFLLLSPRLRPVQSTDRIAD
jgi:hypothetical protein